MENPNELIEEQKTTETLTEGTEQAPVEALVGDASEIEDPISAE